MSWGLLLEDVSLKLLVKGQRGDRDLMGQIRSPGHSVLLPCHLPVTLRKAQQLFWVAFFAICPVGTIILSIWEEKQSLGSGSFRLLPGAAVQDSLSVEHSHRVKTVLENWGLSPPACQMCWVSPTTPIPHAGTICFW